MNSKQIECFFNVARYLNFTEAAEKMFTSQSNISRYISQLEEELDMLLFTRGNNYVRLTPSGAVMLSAFEQVREYIDEQKKFAKYTENGESGLLKIGFIAFMDIEKFFMKQLNQFREKYPNIIVELAINDKDNDINFMSNKNFDLVLTHEFDAPSIKNIISRRICYSQMFMLYGKNHKLFGKDNLTISDFKDNKIWTANCADTPGRNLIVEKIMSYYGINSYKQESTANFENALLQIYMGNGVAIMDSITSFHVKDSFGILAIDPEAYLMGIDIVWNKNNLNPAITLFTEMLPPCEEFLL